MAEGQGITDELKAMVGTMILEPSIWEVERGAIRRFADAIDDPNPLYRDVEYAKNSRYGEIISPPGFFGWAIKEFGVMKVIETFKGPLDRAGFSRMLDGGVAYEFFIPVRAGDVLTAYLTVADISEREGKTGKMLTVIRETTYLNQNGDIVAKARQTMLAR